MQGRGRDIQLVPRYPGKYLRLCEEITKLAGKIPLCLGPWWLGQQLICALVFMNLFSDFLTKQH